MYISTEVLDIGIIFCLFYVLAYLIFKYAETNGKNRRKEERKKEMKKTEERKKEINIVVEDLRFMLEEAVDIAAKPEEVARDLKLLSNKNVELEDKNKKLERNNTELLKDQARLIDRLNALTIKEEEMLADITELCAITDDLYRKCEALTEERDDAQKRFDNQKDDYLESIRKRNELIDQVDSLKIELQKVENVEQYLAKVIKERNSLYAKGSMLRYQIRGCEEKYNEVRSECDLLQTALWKKNQKIEALSNYCNDLQENYKASRDALESVCKERDVLRTLLNKSIQEKPSKIYTPENTPISNNEENFT